MQLDIWQKSCLQANKWIIFFLRSTYNASTSRFKESPDRIVPSDLLSTEFLTNEEMI